MKNGEKLVIVGCRHAVAPAPEIDAISAFILGGKTMRDLTTFTSACNPDISSEPKGRANHHCG